MIARDPGTAVRRTADLVVIGGGVYGIALALEAARRGLRPVLVERDDFGAATSWNSLRIVHGGLRYLQRLDLRRFRESVGERRWWLASFPELVTPLPCLMPLSGKGLHRRPVLRAALAADALLSWDRNRGLAADRRLPGGVVLSARETAARCAWLEAGSSAGGALWFDALMTAPQRLLIEMLHRACEHGALALNYVEAAEPLVDGARIAGVRAIDRESGAHLELRSPVVVNCAGPWCRQLAERLDRDLPRLFHASLALNLLLDLEPPADGAVALTGPGPQHKSYFLLPWQGRLLAGTYHAACREPPHRVRPDERHVEAFLGELATVIPHRGIRRDRVVRVFWGRLPAAAPGSDGLASREVLLHHADHSGPEGLFSVSGVKFTTARSVAERTLRRIRGWQGLPLPAARGEPAGETRQVLSQDDFEALAERDRPAARSYLERIAINESVVHLDDLVLRRHDWGIDPRRLAAVIRRVGELLGWSPDALAGELERLDEPGALG